MTPLTWFQTALIVLMIALLVCDLYYTRRWTKMMRRSLDETERIRQDMLRAAEEKKKL